MGAFGRFRCIDIPHAFRVLWMTRLAVAVLFRVVASRAADHCAGETIDQAGVRLALHWEATGSHRSGARVESQFAAPWAPESDSIQGV